MTRDNASVRQAIRSMRPVRSEPEPETFGDFLKALAVMVMLVAAMVAMTFAVAAYAAPAVPA